MSDAVDTTTSPGVICPMCGETPPAEAVRCPFCEYPLTTNLRKEEAARLRARFLPNPPKPQPPVTRLDWSAYIFIMLMWPLGSILAQDIHWAFIFITIFAVLGAGIAALVVLVKGALNRALGYIFSAVAGLGLMTVCWVVMERYL